MKSLRLLVIALLLYGCFTTWGSAQELSLVTFAPVSHPLVQQGIVRSAYAWRSTVGDWGESLVEHTLTLQGYECIR